MTITHNDWDADYATDEALRFMEEEDDLPRAQVWATLALSDAVQTLTERLVIVLGNARFEEAVASDPSVLQVLHPVGALREVRHTNRGLPGTPEGDMSEFLNYRQAAEAFPALGHRYIRKLVELRKIRAYKPNGPHGRTLIRRSELTAFIEAGEQPARLTGEKP